ncbi:hypothetical protein VCHA53O466_40474 [Vibrio chagasii]|nr:hypothetical protein VCHA53O466_40474 [Vibrio chagasii]
MNFNKPLGLKNLTPLILATILLTGCSLNSVKMVDGTRIPMSELTQNVRWIDEPELLTLQVYSQLTVGYEECTELSNETLKEAQDLKVRIEGQLDELLLTDLSDEGLENFNRVKNALIDYYAKQPNSELCSYIQNKLNAR